MECVDLLPVDQRNNVGIENVHQFVMLRAELCPRGSTSCVLPSRHFRLQNDSLPSGRQLHRSRCRVSSSRSRSPASHVSSSRLLSPASHAPVSSFIIKTQDQQVAVSLAVLTPSLQLVLLIFYFWFISRQDMNKLIHMLIGKTAVLAPVKIDWVDTVAGDKACGLFATTDLPAGFKLGLLEPGRVNLSDIGDSPRERAASVHFCMRTKDGLVVGLQPIFAINPNCLNAMHILNSALRFSKTTPNAKIEKGTNCVALSSPVFEGEEILLHQYLTKSDLSALDRNELPTAAEAHFLFMRTACRHQKAISVFQIQWRNELKLFFIVPPTLEPLQSMTPPIQCEIKKKHDLLDSWDSPASIELLNSCDIPASTELLDSWDSAASINLLDSWDSSASIELLAPHQGFESGGDASDDTSVNENDVPDKLPPIDFATPKLKVDVRKLVRKFGSEQEIEQVEEMIENPGSLAGLQYDGEEGDGDLPGRPAHFSCVDRSGELWRVDVRVLDELAPQPWAIPREREAKVRSLTHLTEEERLNLPRIVLDNDRSVAHPPWHGARELSQHEQLQQNAAFDREGQPWKIVATLLPTVSDSKELEGLKIHKKAFIAWMREHEVPHMYLAADGKRKPLTKPECVKAVWQHFQSCNCDLESDADSNAARDSGRGMVRNRARGRDRGRSDRGSGPVCQPRPPPSSTCYCGG
eukprot:g10224.t1